MNCIAFIILSYATSGGHILVLPLKMINVFLDNTIQKNIFFRRIQLLQEILLQSRFYR